MNKTLTFGYHSIGGHTIIKLNMNLTNEDAEEIRKTYGYSVMQNSRNNSMLHRIEGVFSWNNYNPDLHGQPWFDKLAEYKINAKMEKLARAKADLLDRSLNAYNLHADLTDLPF